MKDEKILKKVGKLLSMYGVSDEEKEKFLLDLKDKKYDDQEEVEETVEEDEEFVPEESEQETPAEEESDAEENSEEEVAEEGEGLGLEDAEEAPAQEEAAPVEEPAPVPEAQEQPMPEETPVEAPQPEEQPMEQPVQEESNNEEVANTVDALLARIEALEDIISKMGVPLQGGEDVGFAPSNPAGESQVETEYDRFNRMRMGRR